MVRIITLNTLYRPSIQALVLASDLTSSLSGYSAIAIALGNTHTCVIVTSGGVKCWGYNGYGQLGIGSTSNQYSPVDVSLGSGIATGGKKMCFFYMIVMMI